MLHQTRLALLNLGGQTFHCNLSYFCMLLLLSLYKAVIWYERNCNAMLQLNNYLSIVYMQEQQTVTRVIFLNLYALYFIQALKYSSQCKLVLLDGFLESSFHTHFPRSY